MPQVPPLLSLRGSRLILGLLLAVLLLAAILAVAVWRSLTIPSPGLASEPVFEVTGGSSLTRVAQELERQEYIHSALTFRLLARWRGVENAVQVGEYQLRAIDTAANILARMVKGDTVQYRLTLVEGWTFQQALAAIQEAPKVRLSQAQRSRQEIAAQMGLEMDNPEGMLFPDTYFYTKDTSDLALLRRAHSRLQQVLTEAWDNRLGALPYADSYDALIMASIIEKESARGSERGHIAGVFVRRLEQGMRLQSDPTVIYGIGETFDGDITRADLNQTTPYNTYRVSGLPPTPIALAGRESIIASLNPLPSDYLYFVSKGDGSHYFSSTLEEHNEAVRRYQRGQD